MSDLVGTQIVGFLTHRLIYDVFPSLALVAATWKTAMVLESVVLEYGQKPPQGHRDVRCARRSMELPGSHVIVVLGRMRREHDGFYPSCCDGIYSTSCDGLPTVM